MKILREETAAVVIDIQERLLPHIYHWEETLQNCLKLIDGLQFLSVPMLVTQQYTKGLGNTEPSVVNKITGFSHIEKITFSCCGESAFKEKISLLGKKYIILCGIETHVCVLQTCIDLLEEGYIPFVVEDCVSSRKPNDKAIAIERVRQEGARITTLESILFELTQISGTETFKIFQRL